MTTQPLNILLLITDNQHYDTLGIVGTTACRTPTQDRIAATGVCFDRMRTTSPVCSPARGTPFAFRTATTRYPAP